MVFEKTNKFYLSIIIMCAGGLLAFVLNDYKFYFMLLYCIGFSLLMSSRSKKEIAE